MHWYIAAPIFTPDSAPRKIAAESWASVLSLPAEQLFSIYFKRMGGKLDFGIGSGYAYWLLSM